MFFKCATNIPYYSSLDKFFGQKNPNQNHNPLPPPPQRNILILGTQLMSLETLLF